MQAVFKELPATLKLAVPIFLGMLGHMLIQLTDVWMLGHYGTTELASSAFGSRIVLLILYIGIGFGSAVSALSSEALGAGNPTRARGIYVLGSYSAFIFSALAMLAAIAILPLYDHLGQPALVAANAKPFSLLIALSFIPTLAFQTLRNYYESLRKPWVPFAFLLCTVGANIFFNYMLIFGKFGAPELGIIGSGTGTVIARTLTAVAFFAFAHFKGQALHEKFDHTKLPMDALKKLLGIACAAGVVMVTMTFAYAVGAIWIGTLGTAALSANQVVGIFDSTLFMLPIGIGYALTNRIGRAKGEGNNTTALAIYKGGILLTIGFAAITSVLTFIYRKEIMASFTTDAATVAIGAQLFAIAAVFRCFDGLQNVSISTLRGIADVRVPAMVYLGFYWLVAMPLGYHLIKSGHGAPGMWWAYCVAIVSISLILSTRALGQLKKPFAVATPKPVAAPASVSE